MARIELEHAGLTFRVREQYQLTLKEYLLRGMFCRRRNPLMKVRALQDVNLRFHNGDRVYAPSRGRCLVDGRISSLFELNLGFEMEASGRQNIFYRGYLQGETPRSIRAKMQEIADFSELGRFLDIPVRFYSAGMLVRLAFSIVTAVEPEILLVDEVLSAGDLAFQARARERIRLMMSGAKIIVMVSHDLKSLLQLCDTGVWLDRGRVRTAGPIADVVAAYRNHVKSGQRRATPPLPSSARAREQACQPA
jgi:ABC-type polysaccharide/polyol phosphate transport system ATPase subunit